LECIVRFIFNLIIAQELVKMASSPPQSSPSKPFLKIEQKGSYAIVTLLREPVNTMNLSMWEQLTEALNSLEANPNMRGVIFQSGLQRDVFTAGNDIMELYAPNTSPERYR
jgi:Delta3-Delta2-enoyl-CoA isomerase